jgi:hypothetical protein
VFRDGVLIRLMEALQEATGETVVLGMQNDLHVQYIHVVQARHLLRYHLHPGTFRPIHSTAAGRMLLAHQSRDAIARLVRQLDRRGGVTLDLDAFWDGLQEVRVAGYAWSANQVTEGAGTMAMLAPKMADGRATVLGVAASSVRADAEGLRVRNGLRVHRVGWAHVHQIVLRPGDAWAFALLRPDETAPGAGPSDVYSADPDTQKRFLVGIQAGDGASAQQAVLELRRRLAEARRARPTGSRAT